MILTASTPIVDVRGSEPVVTRGRIAPRSVVIPGRFRNASRPASSGRPCALIIGERTASTDRKTSLERAIREYGLSV